MNLKEELRLIKEKCPTVWDNITSVSCPNDFDSNLDDFYSYKEDEDGWRKTYCAAQRCDDCWNKAIESEHR